MVYLVSHINCYFNNFYSLLGKQTNLKGMHRDQTCLKNNNIRRHVGTEEAHLPDDWQNDRSDPDITYPVSQENDADDPA